MLKRMIWIAAVFFLAACGKNDPIAGIGSVPYPYAPPPPNYSVPSTAPSGYYPGYPGGYPGTYPSSGYPSSGYPSSGYPYAGYPSSGYPSTGYPSGYPYSGYPGGYPSTGYPSTGYPTSGYPTSGYPGGYAGGYPSAGTPTYFLPQQTMPQGYPAQAYPFLPIYNYFQQSPNMQAYWNGFWAGWAAYAQQQGMSPYNFNAFWYNYCPQQWGGSNQGQSLYGYFNQNFYYWATPQMQWSSSVNPSTFWQNCNYFPYPTSGYCNSGC